MAHKSQEVEEQEENRVEPILAIVLVQRHLDRNHKTTCGNADILSWKSVLYALQIACFSLRTAETLVMG